MNIFNKYCNDILNESIIDLPRNSLDPTVFEFNDGLPPIMHPIIKVQIMNDIEKFREVVPVVQYFAVGSILTKNYSSHSDIDINVQIKSPHDRIIEAIFDILKQLNGNLATGTTHPINYFVIQKDYDLDKTNAAYDVANEKWIKEPEEIDINVQRYMDTFKSTIDGIDFSSSELRRDIIDLETLKEMDKEQVKDLESLVKGKLNEIETAIESLVRSYKNVRTLRKHAFEVEMTPAEIRKYGRKNKLPENVVYKLLERYHYFEFMKTLKNVLSDDEITSKDIKDIKQAGKNMWN